MTNKMYINESHTRDMLHSLLVDMKLDKVSDYGKISVSTIEGSCSEIEVDQLQDILIKYHKYRKHVHTTVFAREN